MILRRVFITTAAFTTAAVGIAHGEAEPDAVRIQLIQPGAQVESVIRLFDHARAPHPAAALAGWKRATGQAMGPGKPVEALIALFNPAMAAELRCLDRAEVFLGFQAGSGKTRWRATLPNDDGSLAAVAPAMALTEGEVEPPIEDRQVFRLGPPGAAVATRQGQRLMLASDRAGLEQTLKASPTVTPTSAGWHAWLDPAGLRGVENVAYRRVAAALDALGSRGARGFASLQADTLAVDLTIDHDPAPEPPTSVDPAWLEAVPAEGLLAVASVAVPADPAWLGRFFATLDRVDRADPARAGLAPLRIRFNLLAAASRIQPEADLWPNLRGVTCAAYVDPNVRDVEILVVVEAVDEEAAARVLDRVVKRVESVVRARKPEAVQRGRRVIVSLSQPRVAAALASLDRPTSSIRGQVEPSWQVAPPQRVVAFWPGRLEPVVQLDPALSQALSRAGPVVIVGRTRGAQSHEEIRWGGLDRFVRDWLERLPYDPPTDH